MRKLFLLIVIAIAFGSCTKESTSPDEKPVFLRLESANGTILSDQIRPM